MLDEIEKSIEKLRRKDISEVNVGDVLFILEEMLDFCRDVEVKFNNHAHEGCLHNSSEYHSAGVFTGTPVDYSKGNPYGCSSSISIGAKPIPPGHCNDCGKKKEEAKNHLGMILACRDCESYRFEEDEDDDKEIFSFADGDALSKKLFSKVSDSYVKSNERVKKRLRKKK